MTGLKVSSTFRIPLRSLHWSSSWAPQATAWSKQPPSHLSHCVYLIFGFPHCSYSTFGIHSPRSGAVRFSVSTYDHVNPLLKGLQFFPLIKFRIWTWPSSSARSDPFLQQRPAHVPQALCISLILVFSQFLIPAILPSLQSLYMQFPSPLTLFLSLHPLSSDRYPFIQIQLKVSLLCTCWPGQVY